MPDFLGEGEEKEEQKDDKDLPKWATIYLTTIRP